MLQKSPLFIPTGSPNAKKCVCRTPVIGILLSLTLNLLGPDNAVCASQQNSALRLEEIPFKIVYETYRRTDRKYNWELFMINADGSNPVNLTRTPHVDEMYPHVSPDGTKICFVADERTRRGKVRNVYYMNIDGTKRLKVAHNARQPCWGPDSKTIAYLKAEFGRYTTKPYATSELLIYDLETATHKRHPNKDLHHIYAICWSPDGNWFFAAIQGGMGYSDAIIAFEADGTRLFDLEWYGVKGCRPDISGDGKKMTWGETDWKLCVGNIDLGAPKRENMRLPNPPTSGMPRINDIRALVNCPHDLKIYYTDFSPDGNYIVFSRGPFKGAQQVAGKARGWNICVSDMTGKWVQITTDGLHNKEPDWVPIPVQSPQPQPKKKTTP